MLPYVRYGSKLYSVILVPMYFVIIFLVLLLFVFVLFCKVSQEREIDRVVVNTLINFEGSTIH